MVSCITKYAVTVMDPLEIRYHLERAWHLATTGTAGPVWLDIPLDVQGAQVDAAELAGYDPGPGNRRQWLGDRVTQVVELLNAAERPVILAGNGVRLAGAGKSCWSSSRPLDVPGTLTWKAMTSSATTTR